MTTRISATHQLTELIVGFWKTQALYTATELGIIDKIAEAGRASSIELAIQVAADADALSRLLLFLDGLGVVTGDEATGYELTAVGELLRTEAPNSMCDHVRMYGEYFYQAWGALSHSIQTGRSAFAHIFGTELFSYLNQHPETSLRYERMMEGGAPFFSEISSSYDFSRARRIVDVAGGHGALLDEILTANPGPRAVLFDVPHVIKEAENYPIKTHHAERCERVGGDFFESVPQAGDVYILSRILHCFDDEACHRILVNCRRAIAPGGQLVILERLITKDSGWSLAQGFNMHMLVVLGGGRERNEAEYRALLDEAGFALHSIHPLPLEINLMVAAPATS